MLPITDKPLHPQEVLTTWEDPIFKKNEPLTLLLQDDLINGVVLPHLCHVNADDDTAVRKASIEILLNLCQTCSPQNFLDIINVIEKVGKVFRAHYFI